MKELDKIIGLLNEKKEEATIKRDKSKRHCTMWGFQEGLRTAYKKAIEIIKKFNQ